MKLAAPLAALALVFSAPAVAQGAKVSSAVELAEAVDGLAPGDWVWAPQIAPDGPVLVLVDLSAQLAFVYRNGVNIGVSTISSGKPGHETPTGVFQILQKDAHHRSSTYNNAPMPFQERLTWDGVALHAGGLPGYPESHGCVHLPYSFAGELFEITSMGGTVVVTGRAGAPVKTLAGGVLSPLDDAGNPIAHRPLEPTEMYEWHPEEDSGVGPLSIVISTSENRMVVMRSGREIGRARAVIEGHAGTHVATLHEGDDGKRHWKLVGVPGHADEANHAIDAMALNRLQLPQPFLDGVRERIGVGTTVLVTSASVGAGGTGQSLTLLSATD